MIGNLAYLDCESGSTELFNCLRVTTYVENNGRNPRRHGCCPDIGPWIRGCPTLPGVTAAFDNPTFPETILADPADLTYGEGSTTYTNPETDGAWWYNAGRPESAGFYGFEAVRVGGLYQSTTKREFAVSTLPCGDLTYGTPVSQGVELVVEGILHGVSCCAVSYGYRAMIQKLKTCVTGCRGTSLRFLSCLPGEPVSCAPGYDLPSESTSPWRTLHNVTMVEYPSIQGKEGLSCGSCGCAPLTWIRFVLRSNPNLFLDPVSVLTDVVPTGGDCLVFCEDPCVEDNPFPDPLCPTPILPEPPHAISSCYCPPVALNRHCYEVEPPPTPFDYQLQLRLSAGSTKALRNFRLRLWQSIGGAPYDSTTYPYCDAIVDIGVSYVPINGVWELLPGQGAFVTVGTVTAPARQSLFTGNGQPRPPCVNVPNGDYVLCVDADVLHTGADAEFSVSLVEFEPT